MRKSLIQKLQTLFWSFGVITLAAGVGMFIYTSYEFYNQLPIYSVKSPDFTPAIISTAQILSKTFADAYLAFLMSYALLMTLNRQPIQSKRAELYLNITCVAHIVYGVTKLISGAMFFARGVVNSGDSFYMSFATGMLHFNNLLSSLMAFVYALTIYILYKHFAHLVKFESEVV